MFLVLTYKYFEEIENSFIEAIISNNSDSGILNSYIVQSKREIFIQDATEEEIININDELEVKLILEYSERNIFCENTDEINYKNYNDIIYNFDLIQEKKKKKKFKKDKIEFAVYKFEAYRGENSSLFVQYISDIIKK